MPKFSEIRNRKPVWKNKNYWMNEHSVGLVEYSEKNRYIYLFIKCLSLIFYTKTELICK
ncbi:MAG: hypothetical protein K0R65_868 [Crocinitomicaceae bacterium]|jgi:hypothetical protein|nr:hypothetical protein [Crocinitomicaceae bacterium]